MAGVVTEAVRSLIAWIRRIWICIVRTASLDVRALRALAEGVVLDVLALSAVVLVVGNGGSLDLDWVISWAWLVGGDTGLLSVDVDRGTLFFACVVAWA